MRFNPLVLIKSSYPKKQSLQQYAEIRRNAQAKTPSNTQKYAETPKQKPQEKTPQAKQAGESTGRHLKLPTYLTEPQGKLEKWQQS
ncbi:hypothetical protein F4X88_07530 [Candidatus Poribacteria bacterium]|nr:hypothetical protein [Candidatus Poribacteria bacterium]